MVSIGRGLMRAPKLLLIDEPSLGLSPILVKENFNIIRQINERGITVFLVEQNVRQTLAISHYGYVLSKGRVVVGGTPAEIADRHEVREAYLLSMIPKSWEPVFGKDHAPTVRAGEIRPRDRCGIVARLRAERDAGRAIYDALCGSGITAKMAARGGASIVTTHALAYFRMQGMSSMAGYLPICDANALTLELGERALINVVHECPLVAGLLCVDPTRDMTRFVEKVAAAGYDGVMNCPTVALIDGKFRSDLEETGMGFAREVEVLGQAARMGLFTKAFCSSAQEALAMAEAGVDNIIIHFGNSSGGTIGSKTVLGHEAARERASAILDALSARFSDRIMTCHGGAIETPADFERFLQAEPRLHGYVGGSSAERFPIEKAVVEVTRQFRDIRLPKSR